MALAASGSIAHARPTAIIISGAGDATSNHDRYYGNIEKSKKAFPPPYWQHAALVADGAGTRPNSTSRDRDGNLIRDRDGRPRLMRRDPAGGAQGPATLEAIERVVRERAATLLPGEPVMIYVTDHGGQDESRSQSEIELWGQAMSVAQLRGVVGLIPAANRVVLVQDQCYGGGMLEALWGTDGRPRPRSCGFAASQARELAFNGGGIMKAAEQAAAGADGEPSTLSGTYRQLQRSLALHSSPISSSELFLRKYLAGHRPSQALGNQARILADCAFSASVFPGLQQEAAAALRPLLTEKLDQLRADLQADYSEANVSESLTSSEIEALMQSADARSERLAENRARLRGEVRLAFADWMQTAHAPLFSGYLAQKDKLSSADNNDPEAQARFERTSTEIARLKAAVYDGKHPPFQRWLRAQGNRQAPRYTSRSLASYSDARSSFNDHNLKIRELRRLSSTLSSLNALKAMQERGDAAALSAYLDILECERLPIGPKSPRSAQ